MVLSMREETPPDSLHTSSEPQLLAVDAARQQLGGLSRRAVYDLLDSGELEGVWIGRRRLVVTESLNTYVARLREESRQRLAGRAAA